MQTERSLQLFKLHHAKPAATGLTVSQMRSSLHDSLHREGNRAQESSPLEQILVESYDLIEKQAELYWMDIFFIFKLIY